MTSSFVVDYLGAATVNPSTGEISIREMIEEARDTLDVIAGVAVGEAQ